MRPSRKGQILENLSWVEVEKLFCRKPSPLVLLPVGARTKEHGLHLPINNDWVMAEYLTRRVLARFPALALPTVPYGFYPAFTEYPGSVSLSLETFRDTVVQIALSVARHGPKKIYVLNTGISTNRPLEQARVALARSGVLLEYTNLHAENLDSRRRLVVQEMGSHADEVETSMMLYIAPKIVRLKRAKKDARPEIDPERPGGLTRDPTATHGVYSPTGAWGDPTRASRKKGKVFVEERVRSIVEFLEAFARPEYLPRPADKALLN
jgi:creatinine amidohydrolase